MLRIYADLKAQVIAGAFAPGERLDPTQLAASLAASSTPVRDALHRLSGERLIESYPHEGFRQARITESAMRDLYEWSNDILRLILRQALKRRRGTGPRPTEASADYPTAVADCLWRIATLSPNEEYRSAVLSINDRSTIYRPVECRLLPQAMAELAAIDEAICGGDWTAAVRVIDGFHRRRLRILSDIADQLRHRATSGR
jgi:hypothetical protein